MNLKHKSFRKCITNYNMLRICFINLVGPTIATSDVLCNQLVLLVHYHSVVYYNNDT